MLDVCINEAFPTQFCDEEGYDVAPFCMVQSKLTLEHTIGGKENAVHNLSFATNVLLRQHAT